MVKKRLEYFLVFPWRRAHKRSKQRVPMIRQEIREKNISPPVKWGKEEDMRPRKLNRAQRVNRGPKKP